MLAYVLFGGMMATTWVQIIKAVLLLSGAFLLAVMALSRFAFSPLALFRAASDQYGAAVLAPGRLVSNPFDAMSLGLALMLGTAGLPHILMRFYTVKDAKTARLSVSYATAFIGFFYLLTFILGFGAMVLVGQPAIRAIDAGGNMAAPLLAKAVGGDAFLGFISAVAFATILAVVAGLTLAGAATLSHDLWVNVVRHGVASEREAAARGARGDGRARRARDRAGDRLQGAERRVHGGAGVCDRREREFSRARAVDVLAQVHDARGADEHARRHRVEPDPDLSVADDSDRRAEERDRVVPAAQSRARVDSALVRGRDGGGAAVARARSGGAIQRSRAADPRDRTRTASGIGIIGQISVEIPAHVRLLV